MKQAIVFSPLFLGSIFFIFRNWFLTPEIIGGDWPYFFPEMLRDPLVYFSAWNPGQGNGLGGVNPVYFLGAFLGFTIFLSHAFNIPWVLVYKFLWFTLPLLIGIFSSIYLVKTLFPKLEFWQQLLSSFIFVTNTYFLMVVGGGQMGIALAYSISPLVLARFIKLIHNSSFIIHHSVLAGLILAVQVMFDPRIAYLSMLIVGIYIIFSLLFVKFFSKKVFSFFLSLMFFGLGVPVLTAILLHAVWIFPILFFQSSPIPQALTNVDGFRFFSFADFSHALSLLHPNWPENIFGKTYFLKSEFLLLPILAYSSLLFMKSSKLKIQNFDNNLTIKQFSNKIILFFILLSLIGVFLAKGANEPFGFINSWMFEQIPGFAMFRDPTKFYLLIALSYSVLIPFSVYSICNWLRSKFNPSTPLRARIQNYSLIILLIFFVGCWVFFIRPAIFGELGGTFREREVPPEYVKLKDFLYKQPGFFRTLWIPRQSRFAYNSWGRMPIEAEPLLKKSKIADIVNQLRKPETREQLSDIGIKYVIIPFDPYGEIFVKDRKYDAIAYQQTVRQVEAIPWLKKINGFGKTVVFETPSFEDYFRLGEGGALTYKMISPSKYRVFVDINQPASLIFSENYHPDWISRVNNTIIYSQKTKNAINSFQLDRAGRYTADVVFSQETFYGYGRIISLATLAVVTLLFFKRKIY